MIDGDFAQMVHVAANAVMLEGMPVIPEEVSGVVASRWHRYCPNTTRGDSG
jgi:hypothetical protein